MIRAYALIGNDKRFPAWCQQKEPVGGKAELEVESRRPGLFLLR